MSFVKVSRAADIVYNYDENGVARVPILVGECKDCALERVAIQPGCSWTPDVYKLEEHNQVFLFMRFAVVDHSEFHRISGSLGNLSFSADDYLVCHVKCFRAAYSYD